MVVPHHLEVSIQSWAYPKNGWFIVDTSNIWRFHGFNDGQRWLIVISSGMEVSIVMVVPQQLDGLYWKIQREQMMTGGTPILGNLHTPKTLWARSVKSELYMLQVSYPDTDASDSSDFRDDRQGNHFCCLHLCIFSYAPCCYLMKSRFVMFCSFYW